MDNPAPAELTPEVANFASLRLGSPIPRGLDTPFLNSSLSNALPGRARFVAIGVSKSISAKSRTDKIGRACCFGCKFCLQAALFILSIERSYKHLVIQLHRRGKHVLDFGRLNS